ncbi:MULTISPECIES: hypothetical protein [Photorhabdus]|uniref:Uncharacterized protein n=1 Tax=Photorhabdus asymbiotica subsp. asymbiotica (strain ATCC 43949 / 3105-77) TaxID=553480 RepID=B6VNQ8_PHOAA|nr:hypothetical protein [Photorhabdus asymbiotica]CAQ85455.1 Hypothetical protein PAU_03367 [Photorhabdus asymbiotica]CAR67789.1 Hypothetical protein PA-RVA20-21-0187 [Photorhabdus asymbiotica subsp. asymbiotica ATCC 43949]
MIFFYRLTTEERINVWFEDKTLFFSDNHLDMTTGLLQYNSQPKTAHNRLDSIYQIRLGVKVSPQRSLHKDDNPDNALSSFPYETSREGYRNFGRK